LFYTSVVQRGNKIYTRGYDMGLPFSRTEEYKPYFFVPSEKGTHKTLEGHKVGKINFDSISDAREFADQYKDVSGFKYYGFNQWVYTYIYDNFPGQIEYDPALIKVVIVDIEIAADAGFPSIRDADKEVTAITLRLNGSTVVFGCGVFVTDDPKVTYVKCENEIELLQRYIEVWSSNAWCPDVVTGWNVEFFDIPYLVNRINKILGAKWAKRLSPWGYISEEIITIGDRENQTYQLHGIATLDYLALYRKFSFGNEESYKLDYIASVVLGKQKVDYSEYGSLLELYKNNYQKFIEYNIIDCVLVDELESKLNFIKQVFAIAYDAKTNYKDTFTTVRSWDTIITNFLMDRNIVVPVPKVGAQEEGIMGGFVKDPQVGMHKWVVSFDLNSLYPHLIMQYNISPDTIVGKDDFFPTIDTLLDGNFEPTEYSHTANGMMFRKDKQGFLSELMQRFYDDRVIYKNKMIEAKQLYEKTKDKKYEKQISMYHNMQMAKKIQLNSAYGALANRFFRWYSRDLAESITSSGQLSIRWMEKNVNIMLNRIMKTEKFDYVIACDTDSMYLNLGPLVEKVGITGTDAEIARVLDRYCEEKLEPFIDQHYQNLATYMNAYDQKMKMKRECIANKGIWTAKKRYILNVYNQEGVEYKEPKLKIQGLEAVRSSTPQVVRKKIKDTIEVIMNKDEAATIEFIAEFKDAFRKLPFVDVAFPRGLNGLNKYRDSVSIYKKGTPIQVKGALIYNHLLKKNGLGNKYQPLSEGDKIKFAYLKEPNPAHDSVIAASDELPPQLGLDKYIDHDMQFEKTFLEPIKTITDIIGWEVEKKSTLSDLFD
jgi:DNA polymerase elongation subunit (family B)